MRGAILPFEVARRALERIAFEELRRAIEQLR